MLGPRALLTRLQGLRKRPAHQIVLHLGTRKTGTTAIQQYLAKHQQDLSRHYLHRGDPNSSLWMTQAFSDNLGDKGIYKGRNLSPEERVRGVLWPRAAEMRSVDQWM